MSNVSLPNASANAAAASWELQMVCRSLPAANLQSANLQQQQQQQQQATCSKGSRPIVYIDKHYSNSYNETIIHLHKHKSDYNLN